jgi:hypothetical protein
VTPRFARVLACGAWLLAGVALCAQQASSAGARPPASNAPPSVPPINHTDGTGAISGVVLDGMTHRPIAGAQVYLGIQNYGPVGRSSRQITDPKGRFVFINLPAADAFFLNASKAGYSDGHYGDTGPVTSGVAAGLIRLSAGQWFAEATIPLWRPGAIAGTIVDERGEPVVGIRVRVLSRILVAGAPHLAAGATSLTDDRGRYRITGLAPGTYLVSVPSVQNAVPMSTTPAEIEGLAPGAAPRPASSDASPRNGGALDLDPSHLLIIGNYVTPPAGAGAAQAYPMAFYPGTASPTDAQPVGLDNGQVRDGIDLVLRPVPVVRVSGHVEGPPEATRGLVLRLLAGGLEDLGSGSEVATTLVEANGDFMFLNVPAGAYAIDGSRSRFEFGYGPPRASSADMPGTPGEVQGPGTFMAGVQAAPPNTRLSGGHTAGDAGYWTRVAVSVGSTDVTGLAVPMRRAVSMRGRIAFDGDGAPPGPTAIVLEPADGRADLGIQQSPTRPVIGEDETFAVNGLMAGDYVLRIVGLSPRQAVKSVTVGGTDYTTRPFDAGAGRDFADVVITYTDRIASLAGSVQGDARSPHLMSVIAFPAAPEQWAHYGFQPTRFKTVPVSNAGTYKIDSLPAGSYLLVAVDSAQSRRWQDPVFLEAAAQVASRVTVGWGETKTQGLAVVTIK